MLRFSFPLDFRLLFWLQEKGKQKGFHNASVKTVVREWVDSGPFSGRGFAEPLPSSNEFEVMEMPMIWIEREAQRALNLMLEKKKKMVIPEKQRMERQESLARVSAIMCTFAIVS
ncbi:hypothetical protein F2Q69_00032023 [Brassica cretica]|uniref:Uncharacterized protein n=1 Tax=Brassica cretica TaxID=69181 RepID=A0A8S9RXL1_BRACR|nr:hypothetical protein F2Q69_00032023 [Brassica cretica]